MTVLERTISVFSRHLNNDHITADTRLADVIFDSFAFMEILGELDQDFGIRVTDDIIAVETVGDVASCIADRLG